MSTKIFVQELKESWYERICNWLFLNKKYSVVITFKLMLLSALNLMYHKARVQLTLNYYKTEV